MRRGAVQGLKAIGGEDARKALQAALTDPAAHVEHGQIRELQHWDKSPSVETELARLRSPDPVVVVATIARLEGEAARAAVPPLLELLRHRNATLRSYSASALRRIGDQSYRAASRCAAAEHWKRLIR